MWPDISLRDDYEYEYDDGDGDDDDRGRVHSSFPSGEADTLKVTYNLRDCRGEE